MIPKTFAHFKIVSFERNKNVKNHCDLLGRKRCRQIVADFKEAFFKLKGLERWKAELLYGIAGTM